MSLLNPSFSSLACFFTRARHPTLTQTRLSYRTAVINITICVACMPACASFWHHFSSNIRSRLSSKTVTSPKASFMGISSRRNDHSSSRNYQRLKWPILSVAREAADHTYRQGDAKILQTFEFNLDQNRELPPSPAIQDQAKLEEEENFRA